MKSVAIESLAERLGKTLWTKGNLKRIYLDEGFNTKKMSTKTFIYQNENGEFKVSCRINCPSQHDNWIQKEQDLIIESVTERINEIIEEFGTEIENPKLAVQATLDTEEQVQGYYMRWHEVRVPINSYGKLAIRKRQKVHTYKGPVSRTPAGFIPLGEDDFKIALEKELKEILYEYGNEPTLLGESMRIQERQKG